MAPPVPWPPRDTDRNRFLFWAGLLGGAAATVYFGLFAVFSDGWLPWTIFIVLFVVTMLDGMGLVLMSEQRRARSSAPGGSGPRPAGAGPPADDANRASADSTPPPPRSGGGRHARGGGRTPPRAER